LHMAALLSHLYPLILLKGRDNFPAFHDVYFVDDLSQPFRPRWDLFRLWFWLLGSPRQ
jgi:hypothetical protein